MDNGIGIPLEYQRKVFGVFERLQDSRKYEGTGIGLAIVARAVQRMGGSCGVESAPNEGSQFWIELPAAG
jgi:signal transduction histidine kinase